MHGMIELAVKPAPRLVFHNVVGEDLATLMLDRRRRTLATALRRADAKRPFIVSLHRAGDTLRPQDHTVVLRAAWRTTILQPGDVVLVTYLPRGGGTGGQSTGKQIGMAVGLLALTLAAPYAVAALGAAGSISALGVGTFANAAVSAGIVMGGAYLLSMATRAKANEANNDTRPVYGVSGGGNLGRPGDRIPLLYGRCWTQPDLSQQDYTVYDGEDQILYKRVTLGLGKYQVHTLMLGSATLWTQAEGIRPPFNALPGGAAVGGGVASSGAGTEVEFIAPGTVSALVPGSVYSAPEVGAIELPRISDTPNFSGPFPVCPLGEPTARIQLDYSLPQGCYGTYRSNGDDTAVSWSVLFEYAPCNDLNEPTGAFTTLHSNGGGLLVKRAQRFTRYIDVPLGRYVVRARNATNWIDTAGLDNETPAGVVINTVFWDGLRAHFAESIIRPHVTEIALRVRSGKGLGVTAFADLWVEATRVLPVWTGSLWLEQATRKAVFAYKDILQATYGAALLDAEVDLERIKFYASSLVANDTFDGVIRGPVSVWEAGATVLGSMRAEPARIGNTWSLTRDEAKTARKHVFSRRQALRGSSSADFKVARTDGAADVIVEYQPGGDPRRRRDVRVTFGAQTVTPRRVGLAGVTSHAHAHHLATWLAASAYFRRERRKLSVNRQGRIVNRGDPVRIDSWFMADAKAAGVMARSSLQLTLDTPVTITPPTHVMLRNRRAEEFGPILVTAGASPNIINLDAADLAAVEAFFGQTLASVMAQDDEAMTTALVGPLLELSDGYLIDAVTPQGREVVGIEAIYDAQGVWDALGEAPPPVPPIPSGGDIYLPPYPVVPWVRARAVQKAVSLEMEWAVGRARGAARYVVQATLDAGATWETVSEDESTSGSWTLRHLEGQPIKVAAFAVSHTGQAGPTVYTEFETFVPIANSNDIQFQLDAFDDALEDLVTKDLQSVNDRIEDITQQIARHAVEQDMSGFLDRARHNGNLQITREALEGQVGAVSASVEEVRTIAVNTEGAFAEYQVSVNAKIGAPGTETGTIQASVNNVSTAFTTFVNGAYANQVATTTASVNNLSATVTVQSTAIANLNGYAAAAWSVTLDVNNHITGIKLVNNGAFGAFSIRADAFLVAIPGYTSAAGDAVFALQLVDGAPRLTLRGDMYADGTITAKKLNVARLDAIVANFGDATYSGITRATNNVMWIDWSAGQIIIQGD